jgi:hypothetical protein
MIRSDLEIPRIPDGWPNGVSSDDASPDGQPPLVQMASTLDYDGATHQLTLTRGDGTVQQFPASNNAQHDSGGRWPNGTFDYERHTAHPDDSTDSAYGSHGNYIFTVPGRDDMGVHSGRESVPDQLGRSGVDHATLGCIRTTDDGTAAIGDAMTSDDPVTSITVRNNR